MSNGTTGNPLQINTATSNWAGLDLPNHLALDVRKIFWESPANSGDTIVFEDADGLVLFEAEAEASAGAVGSSQVYYFHPRELLLTKPQGWFPQTITSGTVWIYFVYA